MTPRPRKPSGIKSPPQPPLPGLAAAGGPAPLGAGAPSDPSALLTEASGTRMVRSRKTRPSRPRPQARAPLPCSRPPGALAAALRRSPRPPRTTPVPPRPITPSGPTPPTGKCSPRGCAARDSPRRRRIRKRSASTWLRKSNAAARSFRSPHSAAPVRNCLALPPARPAAGDPRSPYRDRARRHPPTPRPPAPPESRDLRRRTPGDAGDARHGSPGLARSGDPGDRLRRRLAPLRNRRPRLRAPPDRRRLRLDRTLPRRRAPDHSREDGLARRQIGRGSRPDTCPVALLETWLRLGRISHGPLFRPIARKNGGVSGNG